MDSNSFSKSQYQFLFGIGSVMGLRMLALTLVLPFVAIYGNELTGSTPLLIGLAVGIFGAVQAILQIPFGSWSDKLGRKPFVFFGIILLVIGLFIGGIAKNIYAFIIGRALQGSGAIQSVATAWISDEIDVDKRNKAIGLVGTIVALASILSFLIGPILQNYVSIPSMFIGCGILNIFTLIYIVFFTKENTKPTVSSVDFKVYKTLLGNKKMTIINIGGFINFFVFTGVFIIVPLLTENYLGDKGLWKVLVPSMVIAILPLKKLIDLTDKGYIYKISIASFIAILLGLICFYVNNIYFICLGMALFMMGYLYLCTMLPAFITKISPKRYTGISSGIFNTYQFIGIFLGGVIMGYLWDFDKAISLGIMSVTCIIGLITFLLLNKNPYLESNALDV